MHCYEHFPVYFFLSVIINAICVSAGALNSFSSPVLNRHPLVTRESATMAPNLESFVESFGLPSVEARSLTSSLDAAPDLAAFLKGNDYDAVSLSCVAARFLLEAETVNLPPLNSTNVDANWYAIFCITYSSKLISTRKVSSMLENTDMRHISQVSRGCLEGAQNHFVF